jgi:quercetin dioxygenase-like cupin family protein
MTRPVRAAVLAAGFGFGIAVMVALLGVGQVILEQAHAPALVGGGDLVVSGPFGPVSSARLVISSIQHAPETAARISAISVTRRARLYLITPGKALQMTATGGVPSLERSIGDPEVAAIPVWTDAPGAHYQPHTHEADESLWVLAGEMTFEVAGRSYRLGPGDRLALPAGTLHAATAGPAGATYLIGERAEP